MPLEKDIEKCNIAGCKDEGRRLQVKGYGQCPEARKARKWILTSEIPERTSLPTPCL